MSFAKLCLLYPLLATIGSLVGGGAAVGLIWGWAEALSAWDEMSSDEDDVEAVNVVAGIFFIIYTIVTLVLVLLSAGIGILSPIAFYGHCYKELSKKCPWFKEIGNEESL